MRRRRRRPSSGDAVCSNADGGGSRGRPRSARLAGLRPGRRQSVSPKPHACARADCKCCAVRSGAAGWSLCSADAAEAFLRDDCLRGKRFCDYLTKECLTELSAQMGQAAAMLQAPGLQLQAARMAEQQEVLNKPV